MTRILWQLTMALAFQVAVGMVPNGGVVLKKTRHLSEKHHKEKTAPNWQAWMWASMALGAVGAMGACGARRFVQKQREKYRLLPGSDDEEKDRWEHENVEKINSLSFLDILLRHKTVLLVKGVVGIGFRTIDFGLDVRTGTKFYADGDVWWCGILFVVILASPWPQYLYIKYQRGMAANALAYLIPGSVKHLHREITNMRFIAKLPQISLYRNVHTAVATGTLNEILGGIECVSESLPQAILQMRAYAVKGGDWVNRLSIAFSLFGVAMGFIFGLKAVFRKIKQETGNYGDTAVEMTPNAGQCVDLQDQPMDEKTIDAVLWLAESDSDLCIWNWTKCPGMNDAFMHRFAHKCPHIVEIFLKECDITDDGIQELAKNCKLLTNISLYGNRKITDDAVKDLAAHCKGLTEISLAITKVTDVGVKDLAANCKGLTTIALYETKVTDVGVKEIAKHCKNLQKINLDETKVTDDGLKDLAAHCRGLTVIDLNRTNVTDVGVKELVRHCPKLEKIVTPFAGVFLNDLKAQCAVINPHVEIN